jgi:thiol-disulfide isomerase/thioredoxin
MRTGILVLAACCSFAATAENASSCPQIGKSAPPFSIPFGNDQVSLRGELSGGTPLVISFWRFDCEPCKKELPALQKIANEMGASARFLLIHLGEDTGRMKPMLSRLGVSLRSAVDVFGSQGEKYCANSLPSLYIISAKGVVLREAHGGASDVETLVRDELKKPAR